MSGDRETDKGTPVTLKDGRRLIIRPIRPADKPRLQDMVERMSAKDVRMRFHAMKETLSDEVAEDLTDTRSDRDLAFVATDPENPGNPGGSDEAELYGAVRLMLAPQVGPDRAPAEYAVMVRSDVHGQGLGRRLMEFMIDRGRERGIPEIVGDVLRENIPMLRLCNDLGFETQVSRDDPAMIRVRRQLSAAAADRGSRPYKCSASTSAQS